MANDCERTFPLHARGGGFYPVREDHVQALNSGIKDQIVITDRSALIYDTGGLNLASDGAVTISNFAGVSIQGAGSATASANASTKLLHYSPQDCMYNMLFWVLEAGGDVVTTSVGGIYDFETATTIDVSDTAITAHTGMGFKVVYTDATNEGLCGYFCPDLTAT